jgi:chromosome segregation ATPase
MVNGKCKICGDKDDSNFYYGKKNICKECLKNKNKEKYVKKETLVEKFESLIDEVGKLREENESFKRGFEQLSKEIDILKGENISLKLENEKLTNSLVELRDEDNRLNNRISDAIDYANQLNDFMTAKFAEYEKSQNDENVDEDDAESVKSEPSVRFDVPKEKPVLGSAGKKGFPTREDIIYQKNRLREMKGKELRELAEKLGLKTSRPTGGYKTNDEFKKEILAKLNSWLD